MYMIVGGRCQGKLRYAMRQTGLPENAFVDGETCTEDSIFQAKGITRFHIYVRRFLMDRDGRKAERFSERLSRDNPDLVILSDEVGYGIVPMDEEERRYRETVGRVCTDLARQSARVDRVICGIGTVLKQTRVEREIPEAGIHG